MKTNNSQIRFHLEVPNWEPKHMPVKVLIELLKVTELILKTLAMEKLMPNYLRQRKFPKEIEDSIQLELIGWEDGSTTPVMELKTTQSSPLNIEIKNLPEVVTNEYKGIIAGISSSTEDKTCPISESLSEPIDRLLKLKRDTQATSFDIAIGGNKQWISLPEKAYLKILGQVEQDEKSIIALGTIREIDEKDKTAELHEPGGRVIKIKYSKEIFEQIDAARWKPVNIIGIGKKEKISGLIKEITALKVIITAEDSFWKSDVPDDFQTGSGIVDYDSFEPFSEEFDFDGFMKALEEV